VVPDAYPFAASVDTVIAVVRLGQASQKATVAFSRTLERLRARRIELVLTDAESSVAQAYYYGYHPQAPAPHGRTGSRQSSSGTRRAVSGSSLASGNPKASPRSEPKDWERPG